MPIWMPLQIDVTTQCLDGIVKSPSMGTMMTSNEVALFNRAQDASSSLLTGCRLRRELAFYEVINAFNRSTSGAKTMLDTI